MAHVYKAEEWESNGKWLCGDVSALAAHSNNWWYPARILGISPVDFVKLLINEFNVKDIHYIKPGGVLYFAFSSLADCRKYKNFINKKAREVNFITY